MEQREAAAGEEPREGGEEQPELSAEQQAEAQHQREEYVAELEKLIEEDKLADAEREQLITDLRAAHASSVAELDDVRDESAAQVNQPHACHLISRLPIASLTCSGVAVVVRCHRSGVGCGGRRQHRRRWRHRKQRWSASWPRRSLRERRHWRS